MMGTGGGSHFKSSMLEGSILNQTENDLTVKAIIELLI